MVSGDTRTTRLLTINFGGIGDEILFLPTLRSIRDAHPQWHITLLLEPRSQSIADVTNLIDGVLTFPIKKRPLFVSDLIDLVALISEGRFDIVLSSGSSPLVAMLLFLTGINRRVGYDSGVVSHFLLSNPVRLNRVQYAAWMYHDLAAGLGIQAIPALPQIVVKAGNLEKMRNLLSTDATTCGAKSKRRILIHPGTSRLALEKGIFKTWPAPRWVELIDEISKSADVEIILSGGPDDRQTIEEILGRLPDHAKLVNTFGKTASLSDLAALIELSDLLVCVDSAPMHLGVALGKHLVALFGPTDPARLLPSGERYLALKDSGDGFDRPSESRAPADGLERGLRIETKVVLQAVLNQLKKASEQ